jgi:CTP:molybdopterin cytidylyltransferase MocA
MGTPKGLVEVAGEALLARQLRVAGEVGISRVVVVLGADAAAYADLLAAHPGVTSVVNPAPERGPFSSLQCGLRVVGTSCFVLPVDVPAPALSTWTLLSAAFGEEKSGVLACVPLCNGRGGHPVVLSRAFAARLLALDPADADARRDRQLHRQPLAALRRVETGDAAILRNLNTPADLASPEPGPLR